MRPRLVVAVVIMLVANVAAVYSMAANVAWGWHLLGLGLVFAALGWWARRDLATLGLAPVLLIAAAVQATGLLTFPLTSDDVYRYVWDGRVQLARDRSLSLCAPRPGAELASRLRALSPRRSSDDQPAHRADHLSARRPAVVHRHRPAHPGRLGPGGAPGGSGVLPWSALRRSSAESCAARPPWR